jgi:hypothetical protein
VAKPERISLTDWLTQEIGPAVGNANVPPIVDAVADWFYANEMPRGSRHARKVGSEHREWKGLD